MRVQEVILPNEGRRYLVLDDQGKPVLPVLKYMKYLDNIQKSGFESISWTHFSRDGYVIFSFAKSSNS
ncbi:hypothetical protein [Enterococcus avium]|uniref:hypothetical protein n=1 Tax=Enterococcus avium TaxID=33945 RepID=UPI003D13AD4D